MIIWVCSVPTDYPASQFGIIITPNPMKFLIIGDTHYTKDNEDATDAMEKEIDRVIAKHKPDQIVFLGDTLDKNHRIDMGSQQRAQNYLNKLAQNHDVILLVGNHDRYNNSDFLSPNHPFSGMECRPRVTVVADVVVKTFKDGQEDIRVCCVPYVPKGRFMEAIMTKVEHPDADIDIYFAHQDFARIAGRGDEWPTDYPEVISGHIHKKYYKKGDNIIYPGAPLCHNFGDDVDRFVLLYDIQVVDGELVLGYAWEKIDVPAKIKKSVVLPMTKQQEIELKDFLKGRTLQYTKLDVTGNQHDIDVFRGIYGNQASITPNYVGLIPDKDPELDDISNYSFVEILSNELDHLEFDNDEHKRALERLRIRLGI